MFRNKGLVALLLGASALALPAFGQSEESKSDVAVQALGSFVKDKTENGVTHSASNSGGVLGTYRYYFNRNNGVEFNYAYTLNSQRYALDGNIASTKAYSHEATAAYVWRLPFNRVTPFALAGAGSLVFDPKDISGDVLARPTFVYGAGADFNLGSRWFLRAQYRGLVYNSPTLAASTISAELLTHRAEPSVGFGFRF
ncbi:MAG TPA: outer membrane beta-barrel protein [Bryobacteraceae bacterium]|jgi:opacity protein-like surface antigen|nr:outer membrane beta-barrel protein [Bryobacteraceae bacterium]